jgi:hypothetical protein
MDMHTVTEAACIFQCIHGTFVCSATIEEMFIETVFREARP